MNPSNCLIQRFDRFFKNSPWSDVQSNDFRKSWATDCYNKSGDLFTVSKLLGHMSTVTTESYYVKIQSTDEETWNKANAIMHS